MKIWRKQERNIYLYFLCICMSCWWIGIKNHPSRFHSWCFSIPSFCFIFFHSFIFYVLNINNAIQRLQTATPPIRNTAGFNPIPNFPKSRHLYLHPCYYNYYCTSKYRQFLHSIPFPVDYAFALLFICKRTWNMNKWINNNGNWETFSLFPRKLPRFIYNINSF